MTRRLENKVAIVTGAAGGMGQAAARAFARHGARVTLVDVNAEAGQQAAAEIVAEGGEALFIRADVSRAAQVAALVEQTVARFGALDVLFANAAIQLHGRDAVAHELDESIWDQTLNVNLKGVWLCAKYAIAAMLPRGRGSIILAGSPTGQYGLAPNYTAYSASKGGVMALTRVMAVDYGKAGIRVNALVPGPMETPLTADLFADPDIRRRLEAATMLGRLGQADDISGLAVFLGSDESAYCTGGYYMADGGITGM
jgi:NAD(P)-dependent dehydrogenase (short-subunit alcohol dehydrogenase family)